MSTPTWLAANLIRPCVVRNRVVSGTDEYGNETYTTADITTRCFLQPVSVAEIQGGRAGVGTYLLHLPADMAGRCDEYSQFLVDAVVYEADGPPQVPRALHSNAVHHVEVALVRSQA